MFSLQTFKKQSRRSSPIETSVGVPCFSLDFAAPIHKQGRERERERLHFPGLSFMRVIDAQSAFVEKARYLADMERR